MGRALITNRLKAVFCAFAALFLAGLFAYSEGIMDTNDPHFEEYQTRFEQVAELAEKVAGPAPAIASARYFLCLYGENGMTPDEEFAMLDRLESFVGEGLKRVDVSTSYWEDTILFVA